MPALESFRHHRAIVAVTALQAACAIYFVFDLLAALPAFRTAPMRPLSELLVVLVLFIGSALGLRELRGILAQTDRMASQARAASGGFLDLMEDSFAQWGLTPSERDVALLSVKGVSVTEIAAMRHTQAGTVKAQCAAVYRKAGVNSRSELLGLFIEDLMSGVVLGPESSAAAAPRAQSAFQLIVAVRAENYSGRSRAVRVAHRCPYQPIIPSVSGTDQPGGMTSERLASLPTGAAMGREPLSKLCE